MKYDPGSLGRERQDRMHRNDRETAVRIFEDRRRAHAAVEELLRAGFPSEQIGFVLPDDRPMVEPPMPPEHGTKVEEGAAAGAASGGALGGLVGAALASSILPGIGPVIAGGLLAGALTGAVAGLAGGGLIGALIGLSVPEEEARRYEKDFHSGRTIVTVRAPGRHDEAEEILRRVAESPEELALHPGTRAQRLSESSGPGPGSGSVFPGA